MSSQRITHNSKLSVVLVSGGMDSCVTVAIAHQQYELALLHLNYGQRTEKRELQAFYDIADFYKVQKQMLILYRFLFQGSMFLNQLSHLKKFYFLSDFFL